MIAAGRLDLSYPFLLGVIATVNPCGFVLLPTYLLSFLGLEGDRDEGNRAALSRALLVGVAVSAGFFAVFLTIGLITKAGFNWFLDQSGWIGLGVGVVLVVAGVAMIFGVHLPISLPRLSVGGRDGTVRSMFLYGVSYAVASIGCTLPLFIASVLRSVDREGLVNGVLSIGAYGLGMSVMLTALTVALAGARTGLLRVMRTVMRHVDRIAGAFLVLTGMYLVWYWSGALRGSSDSGLARRVEGISADLGNWLGARSEWTLLVVLGGITLSAVAYVALRRERGEPSPPAS